MSGAHLSAANTSMLCVESLGAGSFRDTHLRIRADDARPIQPGSSPEPDRARNRASRGDFASDPAPDSSHARTDLRHRPEYGGRLPFPQRLGAWLYATIRGLARAAAPVCAGEMGSSGANRVRRRIFVPKDEV